MSRWVSSWASQQVSAGGVPRRGNRLRERIYSARRASEHGDRGDEDRKDRDLHVYGFLSRNILNLPRSYATAICLTMGLSMLGSTMGMRERVHVQPGVNGNFFSLSKTDLCRG